MIEAVRVAIGLFAIGCMGVAIARIFYLVWEGLR